MIRKRNVKSFQNDDDEDDDNQHTRTTHLSTRLHRATTNLLHMRERSNSWTPFLGRIVSFGNIQSRKNLKSRGL
jgi:hypothetical protein